MRLSVLGVATMLAIGQFAFSQQSRSSLTGTVADVSGRSLQGAQVSLQPGDVTLVTDALGQFSGTNLQSGLTTVTISYAGFTTFTKELSLVAGQTARVEAVLKIAGNQQDVQVYAGREGGEVEAINRTFNADNIINVLPADVITSLPNANVADALGRLPGVTLERDEGEGKYVQVRGTEPRLTNVTVDGVNLASAETVRQVKLDIIPANLVESVQINKTLQANMPADGIGGSIDLRTKNAEDVPTVFLESTGGYTPIIGGRPAYQFDGTVGKRFLNRKLGLLGGGSYDWNGRGINDVEPGPAVFGAYDQRDYQYYRDRLGFAGTADYKFSDVSNVYLKGLYSHFNNFGNRWDYQLSTPLVSATQGSGAGTVSFGAEVRRPVQDLGSIQLGGRHVITRSLVSWDVESSVGRTRDKGYSDASFAPISGSPLNEIPFALDTSRPLLPKLVPQNGVDLYDPNQFEYGGERIQYSYSPEVDLGFGASWAVSYSVAGHPSTLEIGGRFRNEHKFQNLDVRSYVPNAASGDASLRMTNFLGGFTDPNYYGGSYTFGPTVDYAKITAFGAETLNPYKTTIGNNFNQVEKIAAGYVMDSVNIQRFRIVAGLRFENTTENIRGYTATTAGGAPVPTVGTGSYLDVLPSASVRYGLTPASGLRLVYGRGLSRPNFSDLVPFASIQPGGVRTTSTIGNPNLRAEHADNLDLLYERNLNPVGLLQGGLFYKRLSDPIIAVSQTLNAGTPNQIIQTRPINAGSAYLYGFEVAYQQHFTYLPGMFSGLGLSANYGYTASQVTFPPVTNADGTDSGVGRTDHPDLLRQAPHTWNISPTYDKRGLSVRLGLSFNAANIFAYNYQDANAGTFDPTTSSGGGIKGPNGDQYLYSHLQVDLQGEYALAKGFTVVAYGLNLNNEVFGFYQGSTIYPIQREFYKQTFGGGLRWSPPQRR